MKRWLENDWQLYIQDTVQRCNNFYKNVQLGELTEGEAKRMLIKYVGDKEKVIEQFPFQREEKVFTSSFEYNID